MKARKIIIQMLLIFFAVLSLFWIYLLLINATKSGSEIHGISLIPGRQLLYNIMGLIYGPYPVLTGMKNSIIVSLASAAGCVYFASLCAYGFHMFDFKLKKVLFAFLLMVMMIPPQVSILGYVDLARKVHLTDTLWAIILPRMAIPLTFYYIYQFMKIDISKAYIEAARIDGAGEMTIFHRIIFPMLKPAIAVQFIFEFVYSWNSYFIPAVLINSDEKKTLPIVLAFIRTLDDGILYAMMAVSILPIIILYIILSKQIIQAIVAGGVKG